MKNELIFEKNLNERTTSECEEEEPQKFICEREIIKKIVRSLCADCLKCVFFLFRQKLLLSFLIHLSLSHFSSSRELLALLAGRIYEISA